MRRALPLVLRCAEGAAAAQGHGREKRWRDGVVSSLVVGDAVQLRLAAFVAAPR